MVVLVQEFIIFLVEQIPTIFINFQCNPNRRFCISLVFYFIIYGGRVKRCFIWQLTGVHLSVLMPSTSKHAINLIKVTTCVFCYEKSKRWLNFYLLFLLPYFLRKCDFLSKFHWLFQELQLVVLDFCFVPSSYHVILMFFFPVSLPLARCFARGILAKGQQPRRHFSIRSSRCISFSFFHLLFIQELCRMEACSFANNICFGVPLVNL